MYLWPLKEQILGFIGSLPLALFSCAHWAVASEESPHFDEGKRHHFSFYVGGTHLVEDDKTAFTFGGDYEYRVNRLLGFGVVAEHAFGEIEATTVLTVADIHAWRGLVFQIGPGAEFTEDETYAAGRIGILYEFELPNHFTIAPQVHYDISHEDAVVFGMAIGRAF